MEDELAARRGGVDVFLQTAEADVASLELFWIRSAGCVRNVRFSDTNMVYVAAFWAKDSPALHPMCCPYARQRLSCRASASCAPIPMASLLGPSAGTTPSIQTDRLLAVLRKSKTVAMGRWIVMLASRRMRAAGCCAAILHVGVPNAMRRGAVRVREGAVSQ